MDPGLVVTLAKPADWIAIRALIIEGLRERWSKYEPAFNPDLESFAATYANAAVFAARLDGRIVGCGILLHEGPQTGRIVRMSVSHDLQRRGVGSKVLRALLDHATNLGYRELVLETTATWQSAVAFYRHHGFVPTMTHNGDKHFRYLPAND